MHQDFPKAEFCFLHRQGPKSHLFGADADYDTMKDIVLTAFDHGVTYFDLANNYGPEPAEQK